MNRLSVSLQLLFVFGLASSRLNAGSWAPALNQTYGTELKEVDINSLPERHYIRKSFPASSYRFFAETETDQNLLHGGFIVVNRSDDRLLASGRFEQGMFQGPLEIYESENTKLVLDYQFGRLVRSEQIDKEGRSSVRNFNLPPQPQAIGVNTHKVNDQAVENGLDKNRLARIAKENFRKDYSLQVSRMITAFQHRLERQPKTETSPHKASPQVARVLSDREFMAQLRTEFDLISKGRVDEGNSLSFHPNINDEEDRTRSISDDFRSERSRL